jgi:hypothetical protein
MAVTLPLLNRFTAPAARAASVPAKSPVGPRRAVDGFDAKPAMALTALTGQAASAAPGVDRGWVKDSCFVPQLRGEDLRNGRMWCGPAVGAMLARMVGSFPNKQNYEVVQAFKDAFATPEGTTPDSMVKMINAAGARVDGQILAGRYGDGELDRLFDQDHKVLAQVGLVDKEGNSSSHWVMVSERNAQGQYLIKDPLNGERWVSAQELRVMVNSAPGLGGVLIPVVPAKSLPPNTPVVESFLEATRADKASMNPAEPLPPGTDVDTLVDDIVRQLRSGDLTVRVAGQKRLEWLERNPDPQAQRAYLQVMKLFSKQSGGGQKIANSGSSPSD